MSVTEALSSSFSFRCNIGGEVSTVPQCLARASAVVEIDADGRQTRVHGGYGGVNPSRAIAIPQLPPLSVLEDRR